MTESTGNSQPEPRESRARRRWQFRLLAVAIGFLPFVAAEVTLRVVGYSGRETSELDPFVEIENVRPLFEPAAGGMAIPASRQEYFRPEQFAHPKPPQQFRIVCLGGSTVQGRPFAIETSFTTWLELALRAAEPERDWEVVNCGGVSYASYRLRPILAEMLDYEPDLVILYTGQNEFLEDRTYANWRQRSSWAKQAGRLLESSRVFRFAQAFADTSRPQEALPAEVDARLDYRGGLAEYHRDDRWHAAIADHYEFNVGEMIDTCRQAGVPMIVCNPVVNLETPPFKSEPESLGANQARFDALVAASKSAPVRERIELLKEAAALSPRDANVWYHLGVSYQEAHDYSPAFAALIRAKDEDVCPLRMTEALYAGLARAVRERRSASASSANGNGAKASASHTLLWCDVRRAFTQPLPRVIREDEDPRIQTDSLAGWLWTLAGETFAALDPNAAEAVTGERWLVDHVHPSINGHQWIAHWLALTMERGGWVSQCNSPESLERRDALYQQHLNELSPLYFEQAKRRLEGLKRWSEGRAFKVKDAQPAQPTRAD